MRRHSGLGKVDDFPENWRTETYHVIPEPGQPPF